MRHPLVLVVLAACGPTTGPTSPGGITPPDEAILVAERFHTPDGRVMYMGAFPDLPTEPIAVDQLTELGPEGDVFACAGHAFFYNPDAGTLTRYLVDADHRLVQDLAIDVGQQGIQGWTGANVCASERSAFLLNGTGGRAVEFDPTDMVIVDAFDLPLPEGTAGLEVQFFEPFVAGDLAYFSVDAMDWYSLEKVPHAILATFDTVSRTLTYDTDDRCQASLGGFVTTAGDLYTIPEDGGFFSTYSPTPELPPDCFLRVAAGATTYDDDFVRHLEAGESLRSAWPIDDEHVLATLIDIDDAPPPEDLWSWFELPVRPTRIHLPTGDRAPYPSVPAVQPMNSRKLLLDGRAYYQIYRYDAEGLVTGVEVVRLALDGAEPAFALEGGDVLALDRLY